jgi:hypothetical protein
MRPLKMRAGAAILVVLVSLLGGCEAGHMTAKEVHYFTAARPHPSGKSGFIQGPTAKVYFSDSGESGYANVFLRTIVKDGPDIHQLYVAFRDRKWIFFEKAYDENGNQLQFIEVERKEVTPGISEHFAATLSDDYLESATETGLEVKFSGKEGKRTVYLKARYVRGYLKKYRELSPGN